MSDTSNPPKSSTVNQRIQEILRANRRQVLHENEHVAECDCYRLTDAEATAQLCKLISNEVINARIDEQVRTRLSSVQRDTIVVHLPDSVISQHDRVKQLASKEEQEKKQ